jgi:hypothetical protein
MPFSKKVTSQDHDKEQIFLMNPKKNMESLNIERFNLAIVNIN